ncbi:MAG: hypothetical protein GY721_13925 [Deltaproteobacteria bacterium]|nr:hypothetical protein [Deltaproteobacteria bacterium]
MKKQLVLIPVILIIFITSVSSEEIIHRIGVFFWHDHEHDTLAFEGVLSGFEKMGIKAEFDIKIAAGDEEKTREIISELDKEEYDLIYTIGTGATLRTMKVIKDTPIIFTAVMNPVASGIVPNWKSSGSNVTGNSNWVPLVVVFSFMEELMPGVKKIGVIYEPSNEVSAMEVREARKMLSSSGSEIELLVEQVDGSVSIHEAAKGLAKRGIEILWIPHDRLVDRHLDNIKDISFEYGIPMVLSTIISDISEEVVKNSVLAGIVIDYRGMGELTVPIVDKILNKKVKPEDIPIGTMEGKRILINLDVAKKLNINIPLELLSDADVIIK